MKLWIVTYHHRHGTDVWPVPDKEPDLVEVKKKLIEGGTAEEDYFKNGDEWLETTGPFELE